MKVFFSVLFLLLLSLVSSAQSELLQQYLDIQQQNNHFSGVVLVTQNGAIRTQAVVGNASYELGVPIRVESVFKVASVSKQFTAMLVALAIEEGKLGADDKLERFFPALTDPKWRQITLHQLLTHTSGLPHNEGIEDYWSVKYRLSLSPEQALSEILATKLLFAPGTRMYYSSPGYGLLVYVLEKVYAQPYEKLLQEKILRPLGLSNIGVSEAPKRVTNMTSPYHLLGDSLIAAPYRNASLMRGSGDLYANAIDLARWNESFSDGGPWSTSLRKMLFTPYSSGRNDTERYGYGWFIRQGPRRAYYHGGGSFGCSALSAWYPEDNLSIVILSNVSILPVNSIWDDIEKIIFNEDFQLPTVIQPVESDQEELTKLAGVYRQNQHELQLLLVNGQLYAKLGSNPPFEIFAESKNRFFGKKVPVKLTFKTDSANAVTGLEAEIKGTIHHFVRQ